MGLKNIPLAHLPYLTEPIRKLTPKEQPEDGFFINKPTLALNK